MSTATFKAASATVSTHVPESLGAHHADGPRMATNLDGMRLLAAAAVVVGHAYDLTGRPAPHVFGVPLSSLAVMIFFITSGWLISGSWDRNPNVHTYLRNRGLRIFPALVVTVGVTTFLLGPALTSLTTTDYFTSPQTWAYLHNSVLWTENALPGVFEGNIYRFTVNGSLWTLPIEFVCYLALPLIGMIRSTIRTTATGLLAAAGIAGFYLIPPTTVVLAAVVCSASMLAGFFAAGAFLQYVTSGRRELLRLDIAAFSLAAIPIANALAPRWSVAVAGLLLPYVVITLALASTPVLRRAARWGDFSYGLYLWAFPVQQGVIHLFGPLPKYVDLPLVIAVSMVLAVASWRWVEKPAMALRGSTRSASPPASRCPGPGSDRDVSHRLICEDRPGDGPDGRGIRRLDSSECLPPAAVRL